MKLRRWYLVFLICWTVFVLPGFIFGLLMVGGDIAKMIPPGSVSPSDLVAWALGIAVLFSPVLLAPVGFRRRRA